VNLQSGPSAQLADLATRVEHFADLALLAAEAGDKWFSAYCATRTVAAIKRADLVRMRIARPKMTITRNPE
jgi:hypothetical protein